MMALKTIFYLHNSTFKICDGKFLNFLHTKSTRLGNLRPRPGRSGKFGPHHTVTNDGGKKYHENSIVYIGSPTQTMFNYDIEQNLGWYY